MNQDLAACRERLKLAFGGTGGAPAMTLPASGGPAPPAPVLGGFSSPPLNSPMQPRVSLGGSGAGDPIGMAGKLAASLLLGTRGGLHTVSRSGGGRLLVRPKRNKRGELEAPVLDQLEQGGKSLQETELEMGQNNPGYDYQQRNTYLPKPYGVNQQFLETYAPKPYGVDFPLQKAQLPHHGYEPPVSPKLGGLLSLGALASLAKAAEGIDRLGEDAPRPEGQMPYGRATLYTSSGERLSKRYPQLGYRKAPVEPSPKVTNPLQLRQTDVAPRALANVGKVAGVTPPSEPRPDDHDPDNGKVSPAVAHYRPAEGHERCGNCAHFDGSSRCAVVSGQISPNMVSDYYQARGEAPLGPPTPAATDKLAEEFSRGFAGRLLAAGYTPQQIKQAACEAVERLPELADDLRPLMAMEGEQFIKTALPGGSAISRGLGSALGWAGRKVAPKLMARWAQPAAAQAIKRVVPGVAENPAVMRQALQTLAQRGGSALPGRVPVPAGGFRSPNAIPAATGPTRWGGYVAPHEYHPLINRTPVPAGGGLSPGIGPGPNPFGGGAAAASQGVPTMMTRAMRQDLQNLGHSAEAIRNMTPQQAWAHVNARSGPSVAAATGGYSGPGVPARPFGAPPVMEARPGPGVGAIPPAGASPAATGPGYHDLSALFPPGASSSPGPGVGAISPAGASPAATGPARRWSGRNIPPEPANTAAAGAAGGAGGGVPPGGMPPGAPGSPAGAGPGGYHDLSALFPPGASSSPRPTLGGRIGNAWRGVRNYGADMGSAMLGGAVGRAGGGLLGHPDLGEALGFMGAPLVRRGLGTRVGKGLMGLGAAAGLPYAGWKVHEGLVNNAVQQETGHTMQEMLAAAQQAKGGDLAASIRTSPHLWDASAKKLGFRDAGHLADFIQAQQEGNTADVMQQGAPLLDKHFANFDMTPEQGAEWLRHYQSGNILGLIASSLPAIGHFWQNMPDQHKQLLLGGLGALAGGAGGYMLGGGPGAAIGGTLGAGLGYGYPYLTGQRPLPGGGGGGGGDPEAEALQQTQQQLQPPAPAAAPTPGGPTDRSTPDLEGQQAYHPLRLRNELAAQGVGAGTSGMGFSGAGIG